MGDLQQANQVMKYGAIALGLWIAYHLYQAGTKGKF